MSGLLVPASLASARRVSIIRTHPLIEPVLQLLRAHVVHLMVLYVLVGHRVDLLVGVAARLTAEVVLARRRDARSRRRLHPAAPNLAGCIAAAIGLAEPATHHARRVMLVLEVGVAVADNATARIAAVEVRVILLELEVALLRLLERRGRVGVVRAGLAILDVGRVVVLRRLLLLHAQPAPRLPCASQPCRRRQHEGASRGEHQQGNPHHR